MKTDKKNPLQAPHVWAFTTYFAEGFPYTIIRIISSVFFRDMKISLEAIGLTSLFGLPWVLKFLWGPYIDQYGTKRRWMLYTQGTLVALIILAAFFSTIPKGIPLIATLFLIGSFIAATHDMAIDGYYMETLDDDGQARFVGYRVMAYRIAMMTGSGIIVTIGATINWFMGFFAAGGILLLLFIYHLFLLPRTEKAKGSINLLFRSMIKLKTFYSLCLIAIICLLVRWIFSLPWIDEVYTLFPILKKIRFSGWVGIGLLTLLILMGLFKNKLKGFLLREKDSFYSKSFLTYMDREKIGFAIAFIILMRTGESLLAAMASPFMVDLGIAVHYGWISGGVGLPFSILGAMLGGWMISKYTLKRTIWPFLLAQNLTNIIYMGLALYLSRYLELNTYADVITPIGHSNLALVASVHAFDQFSGGLGTSVLVTYLMRTCLSDFKASHFAIGTGLMNISGVLSGVLSGFLTSWIGYGYFFGFSFLASIPGMILIFYAPFMSKEA